MPYGRTRPSPFQALAGGFVGGLGRGIGMAPQIKRQRLEQERKSKQEEIQNLEKTMSLLEKHYPGDPRIISIADTLIEMRGGAPGRQPQRMGRMPFPALGQARPIRAPQVREAFIGAEAERAKALVGVGKERVTQITTAKKEEKATLRKRAEQLMKQRRDFLRGDPIMTALGGLIQPQWSDEEQGVELNNILSDLRLRHRFNYPKSVMDALKLTLPKAGPSIPPGLQRSMRDKETGDIVNMRWNGTEWVKIE